MNGYMEPPVIYHRCLKCDKWLSGLHSDKYKTNGNYWLIAEGKENKEFSVYCEECHAYRILLGARNAFWYFKM